MASDTKRNKAKSARPAWKWKSFPPETYRSELARGIHFSIKGINTNAKPACGVRLGASSGRKLPYVSLVRAIADGHCFPLDYTANRGSVATVFKQAANIVGWEATAPHPEAPHEEQEAIKGAVEKAFAGDYVGEDRASPISPRARQLLFPDGNGSYISLIPLAAPVFAGHLQDRWFAYRDSSFEEGKSKQRIPSIKRAFMGFGGANPQNAGRLIRRMQTPFIFTGPTENPSIRHIYALHHRGASLRLPRDKMQAYREWKQGITKDGRVPTDLRLRRKEERIVKEIARVLLARGKQAHALLLHHREQLPIATKSDALVAPEVEPVARGLADPVCREREWLRRFAETVARHIANYPFPDGTTLGLDASAVGELARWIEEEARHHGRI